MPSPFRVETLASVRGAYFRKVQTAARVGYRGIRGVGLLPRLSFDPARQFVSMHGLDHFQTGPLDRPSVYMGGRAAGKELDAGLVWDRVYDSQGRATYTDLPGRTDGRDAGHRFSRTQDTGQPAIVAGTGQVVAVGVPEVEALIGELRPNFSFRPFWRTTNRGDNQWNQPRPGTAGNSYFYAGEKFAMTVEALAPNEIRLEIRLLEGPVDQQFVITFQQERFGIGAPQSFKRINSIDQFIVDADGNRVGLEGRSVVPTQATAIGGRWLEVSVLGDAGRVDPMVGPDFIEVRGGDVAARYAEVFRLTGWNDVGGEQIDISPSGLD